MSIGTIWTHRDMIKRLEGWEAAAEFEQIVLKYQAEQIGFEQDRIIEIIERCPRVDDDYMILCDARHLIALIKGEQK